MPINNLEQNINQTLQMDNPQKKCFVIMPISDQDGYDKGHFTRVYNHIIKPACIVSGFEPIRADDEVKTNYIVIDVIKKILDSEMVICDLSSKNPNVLYELGLRQAFNKKVVLIKDTITNRIFDIQGLRTIDYDNNLRVDEVQKNISQISKTLTDTFEAKSDDINSLVQLLSITPASLPQNIEISQESSLIMDILNNISNRLIRIEESNSFDSIKRPPLRVPNQVEDFNFDGYSFKFGEAINAYDEGLLGYLVDVHDDSIFLRKDDKVIQLMKTDPIYKKILPF